VTPSPQRNDRKVAIVTGASQGIGAGVIKTEAHDASSYAGMGALHPLGRVGEIEDVVGGVLYLESAPFVTGEVLHIDGGQSAGR
jgi:NAD(P)-dependent dehydrogenase (short-subunit alcohol dehydrogenase family)